MVAERHRLRRLQMREARHHAGREGERLLGERRLQPGELPVEGVDRVARPEPHIGRDLVVARARGVEPPRRRADEVGEPLLDVHVDVFERPREREGAALDLGRDGLEPALDRGHILARQDPGGAEHRRMRQGAADVVGSKPLVEADGSVDLLHDLGRDRRRSARPTSGSSSAPPVA